MPKVSKIRSISSRPGDPTPPKETLDKYQCSRCGQIFKRQPRNFPSSQSPLFQKNGGYLPVCRHCIDDLFDHYKTVLGDEEAAMRRVCMKFDIYWHPDIYAMVGKPNTSNSRIMSYISKTNLLKYVGKTYDDTMDEENAGVSFVTGLPGLAEDEGAAEATAFTPTKEMLDFWGGGFPSDFYAELEHRYARWTSELAQPIDRATEALYKQVCVLEATVNRNAAMGKPVEQTINALNTLLGSLNAKPIQKAQEAQADGPFDTLPFGVGIKMCENVRPIGETRYKDVDGLKAIVHTYMYGHLAKMVGVRNGYNSLYEKEMQRMRVAKPEFADEEDDEFLSDIFEDALTKKVDGAYPDDEEDAPAGGDGG